MIRGKLWTRIKATTQHALATGALLPIPTNQQVIEESGIRYLVRVLETLKRKDEAKKSQSPGQGKPANPFLPPEPDLTVGPVTDTHLALLNKFNVVENHLLIVTRRFEEQTLLLTPSDFEALWICMAEYDSLGFYNGGTEAGASQQHKHLQVVPLPLDAQGPAVPTESLFPEGSPGMLMTVSKFPFLNAFVRLGSGSVESPAAAAHQTFALYRKMLAHVGMQIPVPGEPTSQSSPYCLLLTRTWMLLVPRLREFVDGISLNSLAYAGSFFVRDREQLEQLRLRGIMNALREVSLPG